jgi:adenylate cyclase class 2
MARGSPLPEIEIKLPLRSADQGRRLLRQAGFRVIRRRHHEKNIVFDHPKGYFRARGILLRLRMVGKQATLTYKKPLVSKKHKAQLETESPVRNPQVLSETLESLGLQAVFRYEKFRTVFQDQSKAGLALLDETPIGVFVELEGPPDWIDRTAGRLGFEERDYITKSYGELFQESRGKGTSGTHMVFPRPGPRAK